MRRRGALPVRADGGRRPGDRVDDVRVLDGEQMNERADVLARGHRVAQIGDGTADPGFALAIGDGTAEPGFALAIDDDATAP